MACSISSLPSSPLIPPPPSIYLPASPRPHLGFQAEHGLQHLVRVDVRRGISVPGSQPQQRQRHSVREQLQTWPEEDLGGKECVCECWFRSSVSAQQYRGEAPDPAAGEELGRERGGGLYWFWRSAIQRDSLRQNLQTWQGEEGASGKIQMLLFWF